MKYIRFAFLPTHLCSIIVPLIERMTVKIKAISELVDNKENSMRFILAKGKCSLR